MNQKKPYRKAAGEENPNYVYEVKVNRRTLKAGMFASLERGIGYAAGVYTFRYAEITQTGETLLYFVGPLRRTKQKYRQVSPAAVRTVHRSEGRAGAEEASE